MYDDPFRRFRSVRFHVRGRESVVQNVVKVMQITGLYCCTGKGISLL